MRKAAGALIACSVVGLATWWGTRWLLATADAETAAIGFDASIVAEPDDFVADLRAAAQLVRERWSYAEHRRTLEGVDLAALEARARAVLGDAPDRQRFHAALRHLLAGLHDGHAGVAPARPLAPAPHRWPFSLVEVAEGIMLNGVHESAGVARGDLLLAVDGRGIDAWIADAELLVFASTPRARRRHAIERLTRGDDAAARVFRIRRRGAGDADMKLDLPSSSAPVPDPPLFATARAHRRLDEGTVGYFRPGDFTPPRGRGWPGPPNGAMRSWPTPTPSSTASSASSRA